MKVHSYFTPSHTTLYDELVKSIPQEEASILNLDCFKDSQQPCASAQWLKEGWTETTRRKAAYLASCCLYETKPFLFTDPDVIFLQPFIREIEHFMESEPEVDIWCMNDDYGTELNSGFMAIRPSWTTLRLWQKISIEIHAPNFSDQKALNKFQKEAKIKMLPLEYSSGMYVNWLQDGRKAPVKAKDLRVFHANHTIGVDAKIKRLQYVRSLVQDQHQSLLHRQTRGGIPHGDH